MTKSIVIGILTFNRFMPQHPATIEEMSHDHTPVE
jgi:hypothetical protein